MSELRLRLMGTPEVRLDGVRLSIQRRRALALLAFLAVTGRPHRREVLATLLAGTPPRRRPTSTSATP